MSYLTEAGLIRLASSVVAFEYKSNIKSDTRFASISIFLSHSHKDRLLVQGLINHFAHFGISIYVDWQDSNMPRVTSRETAKNIKEKIDELDYFFILATQNAMVSRWVPWEIGIADSKKQIDKIVLIPVRDQGGYFYGNEYLQLYQTIELSTNNILAVFPPAEMRGTSLSSWLFR